ncbi:MAG: ABC transporter permease subunit, partial [Chloroflexota bacterium]|nr:ABC transporter permease subunit [Chloroflexota bacterium]
MLLLGSPVYLLFRSLGAGEEGLILLFRVRVLEILIRTVVLVASVTLASVLIAVPLAWLQVRTDLYGARIWKILTALPLVIPTYVGGFVVVVALGPRGMLQGFMGELFGVERLPDINGFFGAFFLLSVLSFPYVLLPVRSGLAQLDHRLEESSRNLGYGVTITFFKITLPLLRPSIVSGALLVALYTLSDFGAVSLLRYETFTWAIFSQYEGSLNRYFGALLSTVLMLIALTVVVSEG